MDRTVELKANYPMSIAAMQELSDRTIGFLDEDLPEITAFDPNYNQAKLDNTKALMQAAYDQPTNNYILGLIGQLTGEVDDIMNDGRNTLQSAKHFVKKLLEANQKALAQFGLNIYSKVSYKQDEMIKLLDNFYDRCVDNHDELIAAGFTQEKIDKIKTLADNLRQKNKEQEKLKTDREKYTYERIKANNALWDDITDWAEVAKIVFTGNYGKYQRYVLIGSSGSSSDTYHGDVAAGQTVIVLQEDITPETAFMLKNPGTTDLEYCLGDDQTPCTAGIEVLPGDVKQITAAEMGTGSILKVTNKSATEEGSYEVEVL